jgi:hypothetical protein
MTGASPADELLVLSLLDNHIHLPWKYWVFGKEQVRPRSCQCLL